MGFCQQEHTITGREGSVVTHGSSLTDKHINSMLRYSCDINLLVLVDYGPLCFSTRLYNINYQKVYRLFIAMDVTGL